MFATYFSKLHLRSSMDLININSIYFVNDQVKMQKAQNDYSYAHKLEIDTSLFI